MKDEELPYPTLYHMVEGANKKGVKGPWRSRGALVTQPYRDIQGHTQQKSICLVAKDDELPVKVGDKSTDLARSTAHAIATNKNTVQILIDRCRTLELLATEAVLRSEKRMYQEGDSVRWRNILNRKVKLGD